MTSVNSKKHSYTIIISTYIAFNSNESLFKSKYSVINNSNIFLTLFVYKLNMFNSILNYTKYFKYSQLRITVLLLHNFRITNTLLIEC